MALKPSHRRRRQRQNFPPDLNITPFIDILVCLILFLLITAVFGKSAILNLYLPTEEETAAVTPQQNFGSIIPTVAVTQKGFLLNRGHGGLIEIPIKDNGYEFSKLQNMLIELRKNPEASQNIIILPEPKLAYQVLISTMDACREFRDNKGEAQELFPFMSLGEYRPDQKTSKGG